MHAKMYAEIHRMMAPTVKVYPFAAQETVGKALKISLDLLAGTNSDWFGSSIEEIKKFSQEWTEFADNFFDDYHKDGLPTNFTEAQKLIKNASLVPNKNKKKRRWSRKVNRIASRVSSENKEEIFTPSTGDEECMLRQQEVETLQAPSLVKSINDNVIDSIKFMKSEAPANRGSCISSPGLKNDQETFVESVDSENPSEFDKFDIDMVAMPLIGCYEDTLVDEFEILNYVKVTNNNDSNSLVNLKTEISDKPKFVHKEHEIDLDEDAMGKKVMILNVKQYFARHVAYNAEHGTVCGACFNDVCMHFIGSVMFYYNLQSFSPSIIMF